MADTADTSSSSKKKDEAATQEATSEEGAADFQTGGEEQSFLPGGVSADVAEQALAEKQEHDAEYYAQAAAGSTVQSEPAPAEQATKSSKSEKS
jgi:hypothetical protein